MGHLIGRGRYARETYPIPAHAPPPEPAPTNGYNSSDGPVVLNDLLDSDLVTVTVTPTATGEFLLLANCNCQNAPMGSGPHLLFLTLTDGSSSLRFHPGISISSGESHAGVIQVLAAGYPVGTPVTFHFQARASGGSGSDMSAVAIDFSVTEQAS